MKKMIVECEGKSSIMDRIDDCILTEILLHLPMKNKFRCKTVCKRWFNLISSSFFAQRVLASRVSSMPWYLMNQRTFNHDVELHLASEHNSDETLVFNFPPGYSDCPTVFASHNGLILCSTKQISLFVCNPITGEFVSLPDPQIYRWELIGLMVSLNNGNTKFRVVRLMENRDKYSLSNFEVFSSDVGEWRDTGVAAPQGYDCDIWGGFNGVVYDGKLVWKVRTNTSIGLLVYDLDKNECRVLSFNLPVNFSSEYGVIGTCCGRLCYANYAENYEETMVYVCILENYENEKWRTLVNTQISTVIDVNEINQTDGGFYMMPLGFHPFDMDIVYFKIFETCNGRTVSFNLRTMKLISLTGGERPKSFFVRWPIFVFVVPSWPTSVPKLI